MKLLTLKTIDKSVLIKDVIIFPLKINHDKESTLVETMRIDWPEVYSKKRQFFMQYCSSVPAGIAKDENAWHFHNYQEDRITVVSGSIILAVADTRKNSPTKGTINLFYIRSDKLPYIAVVPRKVLHGFLVVSKGKAIILNFPTALYNPNDNLFISFKKVKVVLDDGTDFSWRKLEKFFYKQYKNEP